MQAAFALLATALGSPRLEQADEDFSLEETLLKLAAAEVSRLTAGQWQPIETAPKDGATVLVVVNPGAAYTIEPFVTIGVYDERARAFNEVESTRRLDDVTHWMPLPEPPK